VQFPAAAEEYRPMSQRVHFASVEPNTDVKRPAMQLVHEVDPSSEAVPGLHFVHELERTTL